MSRGQNNNNGSIFGSSTSNQNRTINQNENNLTERLNRLQIKNRTEFENDVDRNLNILPGNMTDNANSVQPNQRVGNNGNILSSQNLNLNITENEMNDEYNIYQEQTNDYPNLGGLVNNEEFMIFQCEAYPTTENNEDKLENFDSSQFSSNTH